MTDRMTTTTPEAKPPMTTPPTATTESTVDSGSALLQVLRDQRKTIGVAVVLVVATYWIAGQLDAWRLAGCIAGGVALGLVNHLATEFWLLKIIRSGEEPTRGKLASATFVRLLVLTVVAVGDRRRLLARRHRAAARPGHLPPHRPGDDHDPAAEGVEEAMTGLLLPLATDIKIGEHVQRHRRLGMTFNIDTIFSHAGRRRHRADPRLLGALGADQDTERPRARPSSSSSGRRSSARSTRRSRTTSAGCTRSSCRSPSRCSSSS